MTTTIYVKTAKGVDEIKNRTHGLPPRARQALILFDGKRTADDVAEMLPDGENETVLAGLAAGGYIVLAQGGVAVVTPAKPAPKIAPQQTAKVALPNSETERLEMAKNFMRNTVQTFLGGMGSGFVSHIDKCSNFDDLRRNFGPWKEAIELSKEGRKQLLDLEQRLMALLS